MMNEKLTQLVNGLAEDLKPEVVRIEARMATTQNRYGDYMSLISAVSHNKIEIGRVVALSLIQAGANPNGVTSALKVLGW